MRIAIITNIITSYREGFYDRLFSKPGFEITVYCQDQIPGMNLKSIHSKYGSKIHLVKFWGAKMEKVGFQNLPIRKIIKNSDVIVLDGNPRILSNLLLGLVAFFLKNKKIIIWSMAHSYGANPITESIRLKWTSLYSNIFVYTDSEVDQLRKRGFLKQNIIGMNNGLDQEKIDRISFTWNRKQLDAWKEEKGFTNKTIILSSSRLAKKNKFEQVIQALTLIKDIEPNILWCVIGKGDQEEMLKDLCKKYSVEKNVVFVGEIFDEEK